MLRRWWPLAAVLALLFLTSVAATRSAPQLDQITAEAAPTADPPLLPTGRPTTVAGERPTPPEAAGGLPGWVGKVALLVLGALSVAAVALVVIALLRDQARRRARRKGKYATHRDHGRTADDLVAALDAGLEDLSDTDVDPRRAVIACWVRLEQAAAAAGTLRHPGDSPTDLVGRLLSEQRVNAQVLAALLDVYRQARYATRTVDDDMRRQARSALQRLRADLGAGVPG